MITPIFYPGQKVVCINDNFDFLLACDPNIKVPQKGKTYTVRKNFQLTNAVGIALAELDNLHAIPKGRKLEPNFNQDRFTLVPPVRVTEEEEVGELAAA